MQSRFVAIALVFVCTALVAVSGPVTKLRVEVRDLNDKPVERASVTIKFMQGRDVMKLGKAKMTTWELKTNQEGVANMPTIPQGKIRIQVIANKYQTFGEVYDVREDQKTIQIKLNPPQQQYSAHE